MNILRKFAIQGANVYPFKQQEGSIVDAVPAGYYKIKESPFGYYLSRDDVSITLPPKIYGTAAERTQRIWKHFERSTEPTAIGLFGSKGAGKSLQANLIAQQAITAGLPVIDISGNFKPEEEYFNFLNSLGTCVVIFDEFLKYLQGLDRAENESTGELTNRVQNKMLTFFSGTNNSKRLFVLIDNSKYRLNEFFKDRPGRMHYLFNYYSVEQQAIIDMALDAELPADKTDLLKLYAARNQVSFDVVRGIIQEWVQHPEETLEQITSVLNVPQIQEAAETFARISNFSSTKGTLATELVSFSTTSFTTTVTLVTPNPYFGQAKLDQEDFDNEPIATAIGINYCVYSDSIQKPTIERTFYLTPEDIISVVGNTYVYERKDWFKLTLTPIPATHSFTDKYLNLGY